MNNTLKLGLADVPAELRDYLAAVPPVRSDDLEALRKAGEALDRDPAFQADCLKSLFVERMLEALEERGETQSDLARRWDRSRQYVSKLFREDNKVNFTIETLCELAHLVNCRISIEVLRDGEVSHVMRCVSARREIEPLLAHWADVAPRRQPLSDLQAMFGCVQPSNDRISTSGYETTDLAA